MTSARAREPKAGAKGEELTKVHGNLEKVRVVFWRSDVRVSPDRHNALLSLKLDRHDSAQLTQRDASRSTSLATAHRECCLAALEDRAASLPKISTAHLCDFGPAQSERWIQ